MHSIKGYIQKILRLFLTEILQSTNISSISDCEITNLSGTIEIFQHETINDYNPLAEPEELSYEFSQKCAYIFEDVTIWPISSIVGINTKDSIVKETAFNQYRLGKLLASKTLLRYATQYSEGLCTTIQSGPGWSNYYHWFIDNLPRLYTLTHPRFIKEPVIYLYLGGELPHFAKEVIQALLPENVKIKKIDANKRLKASKYIFLPYLSGDCSGYIPPDCLSWINARLFSHYHLDSYINPQNKIYISRQNANQRRYLNEKNLSDVLGKLGFTSHSLENYSIREQINLFRQAKVVVGRHGAGLTNLMFSDQSNVLEHFSDHSLNHYRLLCKAKGIKYANFVSHDGSKKNSDTNAPIEELVSKIEELLS